MLRFGLVHCFVLLYFSVLKIFLVELNFWEVGVEIGGGVRTKKRLHSILIKLLQHQLCQAFLFLSDNSSHGLCKCTL